MVATQAIFVSNCIFPTLPLASKGISTRSGCCCTIPTPLALLSPAGLPRDNFAELLRHELNNPLTGILGNAELLLAEVRRQNSEPLSGSGLKRLETIAALAVRMRETVRRLSLACESR
jgi:hypothetical protein